VTWAFMLDRTLSALRRAPCVPQARAGDGWSLPWRWPRVGGHRYWRSGLAPYVVAASKPAADRNIASRRVAAARSASSGTWA
jgi:hypothetical protein